MFVRVMVSRSRSFEHDSNRGAGGRVDRAASADPAAVRSGWVAALETARSVLVI